MDGHQRYAIYWAPGEGDLADFAASWLGWNALRAEAVAQPEMPGLPRPLADITEAPRKYGFHATIKPPFHLAPGTTALNLHSAIAALCETLAPVTLPSFALHRLDGFVALTPEGDTTALSLLAAKVVAELDPFRAAPTAAEIARRRPDMLTDRQRAHLMRWGYPYVMDEFQFHLTLTGNLAGDDASKVAALLAPLVQPVLPRPVHIDNLCLFAQGDDGMFRLLHRYTFSG